MRYVGPAKAYIKKEEFLGGMLRDRIKVEPEVESEQASVRKEEPKLGREFVKKQCLEEDSSEAFRLTSQKGEKSEASSVVKSELKSEHEESKFEIQLSKRARAGMRKALVETRQKLKAEGDEILAEIKALTLELRENQARQQALMQEMA